MPYTFAFVDFDGAPTGFKATLDVVGSHGHEKIVSMIITDPTGLRVARAEGLENDLRAMAQGDFDSDHKLGLPEESEFHGSPVVVQIRAYPTGMLEATFLGQVQYLPRSETFEGLRTLF